jgi:pilus assembly protein Flp/PilA
MSATTRTKTEFPLSPTEAQSAADIEAASAALNQADRPRMRRFKRYWLFALTRDRSAVTALEYGLIAALIAVVIITAVKTLGTNLQSTFNTISNHFTNGTVN